MLYYICYIIMFYYAISDVNISSLANFWYISGHTKCHGWDCVIFLIVCFYLYHLPKERAATKAVVILLAHRTAAWSNSTPPLEMAPKQMAAIAARKPTTVAWTYRTNYELLLLYTMTKKWHFNMVIMFFWNCFLLSLSYPIIIIFAVIIAVLV